MSNDRVIEGMGGLASINNREGAKKLWSYLQITIASLNKTFKQNHSLIGKLLIAFHTNTMSERCCRPRKELGYGNNWKDWTIRIRMTIEHLWFSVRDCIVIDMLKSLSMCLRYSPSRDRKITVQETPTKRSGFYGFLYKRHSFFEYQSKQLILRYFNL